MEDCDEFLEELEDPHRNAKRHARDCFGDPVN